MSSESQSNEVVEIREEKVENPDGTFTIKTIKTVMVEESEEEEEGEELTNGNTENLDMGQLTEEEIKEFQVLQAQRKWLDAMAGGGEETGEVEEEKPKKKKKRAEGDKKGKKKKKVANGKENKVERDLLAKHVGPRYRSFDSAKMKKQFEKKKEPVTVSSDCKACSKQVFQMEKIVAEKAAWHKNCFRCSECSKTLTLESYQSHEGTLYCKPHFRELFRPKAVVEDEAEARKERMLRRPKMIVLESNPDVLPDDVVRATAKPDYGLEELGSLNVRDRFSMFEAGDKEDDRSLEPIHVKRSQSMINRAARFLRDGEDSGEEGSDLEGVSEGEEEGEEDVEEEEEELDEDGNVIEKVSHKKQSKKEDLAEMKEKRTRREEGTRKRKEELGRFRQMLCAGKNSHVKDMFESGTFGQEKLHDREEIKIDESRAAKGLKEKFEKGLMTEAEYASERAEVEEIFRDAETAKKARNLFNAIDSAVEKDGSAQILRSQSFGQRDNRRSSQEVRRPIATIAEDIIRCHDAALEEEPVETEDLASKFMFFAKFEDRQKESEAAPRKVFRITPPRDSAQGVGAYGEDLVVPVLKNKCAAPNCSVCKLRGLVQEETDFGRDPNLIKCTDNYQDEVDCRNTQNVLNMFKKLESKYATGEDSDEAGDENSGPRPLHRFTPPPEGESEYEDDEYSGEEGEYTSEDGEEDEEDDEDLDDEAKEKYKDEILQMLSAKKAANLRAKFEKWEAEENRQNQENKDGDEVMPSLDSTRNLRSMFESKAQEASKVQVRDRPKVNRFV